MWAVIVDFFSSPAVLAVLSMIAVAVLDAVLAAMGTNHPLLARLLAKLADMLRSNKIAGKPLLALAVLFAFAARASADTITTTDGKQYTKAADGKYYPSAYVKADGSVSLTPVMGATATPVAKYECDCGGGCNCNKSSGPNYYVCPKFSWGYCPVSGQPSCVGGSCGVPQAYPMGGLPVYRNPTYSVPQRPACNSCQGGACYPASPFGFRRR